MQPTIDLLVSNHNTSDLILSGIVTPLHSALLNDVKLTVLDDGSDPAQFRLLREHCPVPLRLLQNTNPVGIPANLNQLLDAATLDHRILCDSDIVFRDRSPIDSLIMAAAGFNAPSLCSTGEGPNYLDMAAKPYSPPPQPCARFYFPQDYCHGSLLYHHASRNPLPLRFDMAYNLGSYNDTDLSYQLRARGWETLHVHTNALHLRNQSIIRRDVAHAHELDYISLSERIETCRQIFMSRWSRYMHPRSHDLNVCLRNHSLTNSALQERKP